MEIVLAGETFGVEPKAPAGLILKISEAEAAKDFGRAMALTLRMLRLLVAEADRDRFEELIESPAFDSLEFEDIQSALQQATAGAAARPTGKSEPLPAGLPTTLPTSKVVRLSRATSPASSTDGASLVS